MDEINDPRVLAGANSLEMQLDVLMHPLYDHKSRSLVCICLYNSFHEKMWMLDALGLD